MSMVVGPLLSIMKLLWFRLLIPTERERERERERESPIQCFIMLNIVVQALSIKVSDHLA